MKSTNTFLWFTFHSTCFFNIPFFQKFLMDFLYPLRCEIQRAFRPHKTAFLGFYINIYYSFLLWAHCNTCLKGNYIFILFHWFGCFPSQTVPLRVFTFFPGSTGISPIRRLWSKKTSRQVNKLTFSPPFFEKVALASTTRQCIRNNLILPTVLTTIFIKKKYAV